MLDWAKEIQAAGYRIRLRALDVCAAQKGGYLIQVCGSAEILMTLYSRMMQLGDNTGPLVPDRFAGTPGAGQRDGTGSRYNGDLDRFFLSPAHYALALYSTLVEVGRLDAAALDDVNGDGSTLEMIGAEHSPGFEVTSGSLAQALSVAVGTALARKRFNRPGRVWAFISDGELEEGQTWEALAAAAHYKLDNLTVLLDANNCQVSGAVSDVMGVEPIAAKVSAFGATVHEVDGHDPAAIASACTAPSAGRPTFIICRTTPWRGIEPLRERHQLHYIRFVGNEVERARASLTNALNESTSELEKTA